MGRPRTCSCGSCRKCKDRLRKAEQYAAMTVEQRRAWVKSKDQVKRYETNRRARRRHEARYPEKALARDLLQRALRSGRVVRQPCEVCGATEGVEGHHDNYNQPLNVRWLCRQHHRPPWTTDRG